MKLFSSTNSNGVILQTREIKIEHGLYCVKESRTDESGAVVTRTVSTHRTMAAARAAANMDPEITGDNRDPEDATGYTEAKKGFKKKGSRAPVNTDDALIIG